MIKILIFTDYFLPGYKGGGPITSISNLVSLLNDYFKILICTRDKDFGNTESYKEIQSNQVTIYQKFNVIYLSEFNKHTLAKTIEVFHPDVIYLNSFFSKTTLIVILLNKFIFKKKLIVAPRGELQENALNIKKTKKSIYLFLYKLFGIHKSIDFHSTDAIETNSIKNIFNTTAVTQLQNAVKIYNFEPLSKQENEIKIIFVSRVSRKKNLHYALDLLKNVKYNILFDIYGPKEDIEYWNECQNIINTLPTNIRVSYQGSLPQSDIIYKMREYHAFLFPTLSENFGHVIVEAMQAGLVPIISNQTPWLNLEKINAGWDIPLDDKFLYVDAIEKLYLINNEEYTQKSLSIMKYIHNKLDMQKLKQNYINFFNQIKEK